MKNSNGEKKSVALWYEADAPEYTDVHINYWLIPERKGVPRKHFIDIGLKLQNWKGGRINLYLPFSLSKDHLSDLGAELQERQLANSLFNENCRISTDDEKRIFIKLSDTDLTVFKFDKEYDVQCENNYGGTIISIDVPEEERNWYLRFRLQDISHSKDTVCIRSVFSQTSTPRGSLYQSMRSSIDMIDFRLNRKQSLDATLLDKIKTKLPAIRKLHFLLICEVDEEFSHSTHANPQSRLLEENIWQNYLKNAVDHTKKNFIASHWKAENLNEGEWSIFLKTRYSSTNTRTILKYLGIAVLIAFVINMFSNTVYDFLNSLFVHEKDNGSQNVDE
jgi:hypothetical protein